MKSKFLKIAGVKSEKEFYKKYPTEKAFFAKYGAKIKAFGGVNVEEAGGFLQNLTGGEGVGGALKGLTGGNPVGTVMDTIQGFKAQKENVAQAKQNMLTMGWLEDAQASNKLYEQENLQDARMKTYVRPEDNVITGEELFPMQGVGTNVLAKDGININPKNKGKFTAAAKAMGHSVQEHAKHVLADPNATALQKKRANFARNAAKWKHQDGGTFPIEYSDYDQWKYRQDIDTTGLSTGKPRWYPYTTTKLTGPGAGYKSKGVIDANTDGGALFDHVYPLRKDVQGNRVFNANRDFESQRMQKIKSKIQDERGMNQKVSDDSYNYGGTIKAKDGFLGTSAETWKGMGMQGLNTAMPQLTQSLGIGGDMGSQIGGKVGGMLGKATGIPGMDKVGQLAFGAVGDLLDKSDTKIERYNKAADTSLQKMVGMNVGNKIQGNFGGNLKNGGNIYGMGGDVKTYGEGGITPISDNPYGGEMGMINGPSHNKGGVDMSIFGQEVEAEGGEPIMRMEDGGTVEDSMVIMGNLEVPSHIKKATEQFSGEKFSGKKFKNVTKNVGLAETKTNNMIDKNINKAKEYTKLNPLDRVSLNTLDLNTKIGDNKLQKLQVVKETLASAQEAINMENENARYGKRIYAQNGVQETDPKKLKATSKQYKGIQPGKGENLFGRATKEDLESLERQAQNQKWWKDSGYDSDFSKRGNLTKFQELYNANNPNSVRLNVDGMFGDQMASVVFTPNNIKKGFQMPEFDVSGELQPIYKKADVSGLEKDPEKPGWDLSGLGQLWRDTDAEDFNNAQLLPEAWAMANNKLEPVQSQKYNPNLDVPYDISRQAQLNLITSKARGTERMLAHNPGLAANQKAQEWMADQVVKEKDFVDNQGMKHNVYSKNRATLNDAQLKNLAIQDVQYDRQEQAKAITKATDLAAIKSMTDKKLKHNLENQTLRVMENLYDYRFSPSGRANYMGESADFNDWAVIDPQTETIDTKTYDYLYDENGKPIQKKVKQQGTPTRRVVTQKDNQTPSLAYNPFNGSMNNGGLVKKIKKFK